jgi:NADP-dependent 3-hydroxy acid dehydrogenase YdfG
MNNSLTDHVAFVTGASSGIGRAVAMELSRRGAKVVVGARRMERLESLVEEAATEMLAVELDVTDPESAARAVAAALDRFGRLDSLINNAGLMQAGLVLDADPDQWVRMVETNLLGSMFAVHAALPHLIRARGAVVQVSSTSGRIASAGSGAYAATKFGIAAFIEALRQEVTSSGVRVTTVEPGFVSTELTTHITDPVMRSAAADIERSMRTLTPDDVAEVIAFALSQPARVAVNEILIRPTDQVR